MRIKYVKINPFNFFLELVITIVKLIDATFKIRCTFVVKSYKDLHKTPFVY